MKKIFSIIMAVFMIFTFSITASAKNGTASLQQKMNAKEKIAGTAKIIAQTVNDVKRNVYFVNFNLNIRCG